MGWQPGGDGGKGQEPGSGLPGRDDLPPRGEPAGLEAAGRDCPGRDPHLSRFARDAEFDACPPSAGLAAALEAAAGTEWRCPDASHDELLGLLRQWQAVEAWAAAGRLGVLRALIREDAQPLPGGGYHGELPDGWSSSLTHEVALALSTPAGSAERLMWFAWDLQVRLPGIGALLAAGRLTFPVAKAVCEPFQLLTDENAAKAEAMILAELPGKTYGQAQQLAVRAAIAVDPEAVTRRRQDAERNRARVQMFREESGAAALSGRDLPTDQTLAAHASVCARATQYKDSGAFPADTRMDQYRAAAYLDLLNGIPAAARIASGQLVTASRADAEPGTDEPGTDAEPGTGTGLGNQDAGRPDGDEPGEGEPDGGGPGDGGPSDSGPSDSGPGDSDSGPSDSGRSDSGPSDSGPSDGGPGDRGSGDSDRPSGSPALLRPVDLILPLATLLGLAERPGEGHGLGPLDPDLCRELAVAAVASPLTGLCVTVTDRDGIALAHGCAKVPTAARTTAARGWAAGDRARAARASGLSALPLPARLNLTITADRLALLAGREAAGTTGPPGRAGWSLIRAADPGPPGGYGTWMLTLPGGTERGTERTVSLEPVPAFGCDHRHESHAYQPNAKLRHLVQVRDYTCTFPCCSRHARESDFEHAVPYDQGGRTCACNAGARSRRCHRVKQSPDWTVTQPRPGWHQWETPAGRRYTQGPKRYPF
jgi:hypothetical protein